MKSLQVISLIALLSNGYCATASVLESVPSTPEGWTQIGDPEASKRLHFRIAVAPGRQGQLEETVSDISTPGHARYGQHLSRAELKRLIQPHSHSTVNIHKWLTKSGVSGIDIHDDGDWIEFVAPVSIAEKMMDTKFHTYESDAGNERVRTLQYSIPDALEDHIDMIQPTVRFGQESSQEMYSSTDLRKRSGIPKPDLDNKHCDRTVTPQCIRNLYNMHTEDLRVPNGSFLGVAGFLNTFAQQSDLTRFLKTYAPNNKNRNFAFHSVNGGRNTQGLKDFPDEGNLDTQLAVSLADPVPVTFYMTPGSAKFRPDLNVPKGSHSNEPYLDFLTHMLSLPRSSLPSTLVTSYNEPEQTVPPRFAKKVCQMYAQLGARGVSVIFSSGNSGPGEVCLTNDGHNTTRFLPNFPSSCPFVTTVGGTEHVPNESAISTSGGGFSDLFPRPAYQNDTVNSYLADKLPKDRFSGLFNPNGRAYPDVAATSTNIPIYYLGNTTFEAGTSAAAPIFASAIAAVNARLRAAGRPGMGFLNPWLYQGGGWKAFNDITKGGSEGCDGSVMNSNRKVPKVVGAGWNATEGWDPVTGFGTPDLEKIMGIVFKSSSGRSRLF